MWRSSDDGRRPPLPRRAAPGNRRRASGRQRGANRRLGEAIRGRSTTRAGEFPLGATLMTTPRASDAPDRLRVLSANLWNGRAHAEGFAALVEQLEIDVVAVQELARRRRTRSDAACRTHPRTRRRLQRHGHRQPHPPGGAPPGAAQPRRPRRRAAPARGDGAPVAVELVNIHVEAPHNTPTWRTVERRRGQWRALERHLRANPHRPRWCRRLQLDAAVAVLPAHRRPPARRGADPRGAHRRSRRAHLGPLARRPRLLRIDHASSITSRC